MSTTVTVDAPELARGLSNALIFMPAKNTVPYAALTINTDEVVTFGSFEDIAIGTDTVAVESFTGDGWSRTVLISPADLTALERAARTAGKLTAEIRVDALSVTLTPMGLEPVTAVDHAADTANLKWLEQYEALHDMLNEVEEKADVMPPTVALGRGYFSKFDKVKTNDKNHTLHLKTRDEYYPVFVKCGPTFRGMVAPVHEPTYSKNIGTEGLW